MILRPLLLSFFLTLLLGSCSPSTGGGCQGPWVSTGDRFLGTQAPNFVLPNLSGQRIELATVVSQKPTLLVFWATWCPTCKEEIPLLNEWSEKYPELKILGINVEELPERVKTFAEKYKIHYEILLDQEGEIAQEYGLVGVPSSILLAKGGKVIYYGFSLPENIEPLIKE